VEILPPAILHEETFVAPFQDMKIVRLGLERVGWMVETEGGSRGVADHSLRKAR